MAQPLPYASPPQSPTTAVTRTSKLAVTAFVLACLFFIPLLPLIGTILGIVALVRMRPDQGGKGLAIAAIPVGLVMVLMLQGMLAAIAIPSFIKYTRKAKSVEALQQLDKIKAGARAHLAQQEGAARFPVAHTDWVPATPCCEQPRQRCVGNAAAWSGEPWSTLHIMGESGYYQYRYRSDGNEMIAEARGDLDCDGTFSSYRLVGELRDGQPVFQGPIIERDLD